MICRKMLSTAPNLLSGIVVLLATKLATNLKVAQQSTLLAKENKPLTKIAK